MNIGYGTSLIQGKLRGAGHAHRLNADQRPNAYEGHSLFNKK